MEISDVTADGLYAEALWQFRRHAVEEETRNGRVLTHTAPVSLRLMRPDLRVLYNDHRDANPFFHLMEAIWMWAGRNDLKWIQQFNKGIAQYADEGVLMGAYGWRWRSYFGFDQLNTLATSILRNPTSRQHVLQMWHPRDLYNDDKDKPCNTQIMFRVVNSRLNMTVINRSNDLIWGALGANIVHMTMLQELMARSTGVGLGVYRVFSNNLHVYERHWGLLNNREANHADTFRQTASEHVPRPLHSEGKTIHIKSWLQDAERFCEGKGSLNYSWFNEVATPMRNAYLDRERRNWHIKDIQCPAWRHAAELWSNRRGV